MKSVLSFINIFVFPAFVGIASEAYSANLPINEPLSPLPPPSASLNPAQVALGQELFFEKRLSADNSISCASCHDPAHGGVDGRTRSIGIHGAVGAVNAPSVFNSGLNFRQFWDGRAETLESQIDGPVQNPLEMGSSWDEVISKLKRDPDYVSKFQRAFGGSVSQEKIKTAIASFERALITPNSRFDQFLQGNKSALTEKERRGYARFKSFGCIACHQGANVGGNMFQTIGVMGDYFADRGPPFTDADLGRYNVTKLEADRHVFRVPSLRNVALTAPYFHDGSSLTLEAAVNKMGIYQVGQNLKPDEIADIVAFLRTLTGELPEVLREKPKAAP